jgi:serine protease Do
MAAPKQTLYDILGVSREANAIDIGLAYQKAIAAADRAVPPDPTRQALIQQAHEILGDGARRAAYDSSLVTAAERDAAREQAAAPDLDLGAAEDGSPRRRKLPWLPIGAAILVVLIGAVLTLRQPPPMEPKAPDPGAQGTNAVPAPAPSPRSAAEILALAAPSVGRVFTYDMSGRMAAAGLAFAVEPSAMVGTCEGLTAGSQVVVKIGADSMSATLAITDETLGLCRLLVPGAALKPLPLAPEDARAGDPVHVLGANEKGDMALTQGAIGQVRNTPVGPVLELSMPIAPAGSGGAVFDNFGRVVGVATRREGAGASAALPASSLSAMRSRSR